MKISQNKKRKFATVPDEQLKEWNNLFNDRKNWGIRSRLLEKSGIKRDTLDRVLFLEGEDMRALKRLRTS